MIIIIVIIVKQYRNDGWFAFDNISTIVFNPVNIPNLRFDREIGQCLFCYCR